MVIYDETDEVLEVIVFLLLTRTTDDEVEIEVIELYVEEMVDELTFEIEVVKLLENDEMLSIICMV